MLDIKQQSRIAFAACLGTLAAAVICFWWLCVRSPKIPFLPDHAGAEWIIYPKPPDGQAHFLAELDCTFRRQFVLNELPPIAEIHIRAFGRFEVLINGQPLPQTAKPDNWKAAATFGVTPFLHVGTNNISVTVFNKRGPPALWLTLDAASLHIASDSQWEASLVGAVWQNAWPAALPIPLLKGHPLSGGESTAACFSSELPRLALFALLSILLYFPASRMMKRYATRGERSSLLSSRRVALYGLIGLALLWAALFLNNLRSLPNDIGYDVVAHLDYIDYLRTHHSLPLATDGWEMCQPPLYYLCSALLLAPFKVATAGDTAVRILRMTGLFIGVAHFTLVFLCARLLFPRQLAKQFVCLVLAALIPEQLYLSQYITNELLAATLTTASVYFCLRLLKNRRNPVPDSALVGVFLGAALLTKATPVVATPFILGAVACWPIVNGRPNLSDFARTLGLAALLTVAVGGWHYFRVWKHFGTPLVHDWDEASGFAWWTDAGFRTTSSAFGFGDSLIHPFYSAFRGFADGIYSTLWGDGSYGGETTTDSRPPWDYRLMAAGYLLALVPTILVLVGFVKSALQFLRRPRSATFLLLGIGCATFAALLYMNLKLPFYCNSKAFYALTALLPVCAAAAVGWDTLAQSSRAVRAVLFVLLGVWALSAFTSFWVNHNSAATHALIGMHLCPPGRLAEASRELSLAEQLDPHEIRAARTLALVYLVEQRPDDARRECEKILAQNPDDANACLLLARTLASQRQLDSAYDYARKALLLAPDLAEGYQKLCAILSQLGNARELELVAREGLRLDPMNSDLHFYLANALAASGDPGGALTHRRFVCAFKPSWPDGHDQLGLALMNFRQSDEAISEFSLACQLNPGDADFHLHLANAYAFAGQPAAAVKAYRETIGLNANMVGALNKLAWLLATSPDDHLRDGNEAVRLAEHACQLTDNHNPEFLGIRAAAYAEAGRFADAVASAQSAIELARAAGNTNLAAANTMLLDLYRANRPYHQ